MAISAAGPGSATLTEFSFNLPGTPTSWNPIEAFKQGLADEPEDQKIPITVWRCPQCGTLEMAAVHE